MNGLVLATVIQLYICQVAYNAKTKRLQDKSNREISKMGPLVILIMKVTQF